MTIVASNAKTHTFNIGDYVYDPQTMETGKVIALCEGSQDERLHDPPKGTPIVQADDSLKAGSAKGTPWPSAQPLQWLQTCLGYQMLLPHFAGPGGDLNFIRLEETAAVLSRICRFGARTTPIDITYSVAEHSVRVADCVRDLGGTALDQWSALNHEGDEALLGFDPPSPMLRLLPDLRALKQKAHEAYCRRYGLPVILPPIVKHADLVLLATEKRDVMLPAPAEWMKMPDPLVGKIRAWPNPYARFVKRWRELAREVDYKGVE